MKRIITTLSIAVSAVVLLAGCQFTVGATGAKPIDLTDSASISALCGDDAVEVQTFVASAADAKPTSGKRNALAKWGITDPADDEAIASILATLDERAQVECDDDIDATPASDKSTNDTKLSQELLDLLDASYAEPGVCPAIVAAAGLPVVEGYYDLLIKALYEVNDKGNVELNLKWSDALSTALPGNTPEEKYTSLKVAICTEPVVGVALAHLFAHLEINGVFVRDLQVTKWLDPYNVPDKQINDLVASFVPNFTVKIADRTEETNAAALDAMTSYQDLADKLIKLLSRYQLVDVRAIDSTHHYHLVGGGLTADGIPEIEVSSELDNRPALVFFLTEKTACVPISVLAFNVGDKRPELANIPADCSPFLPPPPVTPECTYDCGGTTECTYDCGPPPCVVNCGGEKTDHVPVETTPDGETEPPAPPPTSPPAPPEVVDTTPVEEVDTGTELPPQDTSGTNTGTVSE